VIYWISQLKAVEVRLVVEAAFEEAKAAIQIINEDDENAVQQSRTINTEHAFLFSKPVP